MNSELGSLYKMRHELIGDIDRLYTAARLFSHTSDHLDYGVYDHHINILGKLSDSFDSLKEIDSRIIWLETGHESLDTRVVSVELDLPYNKDVEEIEG